MNKTKKIKFLEIEQSILKEKKSKIRKRIIIKKLKEFINKEEREKEEKFEIFPNKISEVKERVFELVMQKNKNNS